MAMLNKQGAGSHDFTKFTVLKILEPGSAVVETDRQDAFVVNGISTSGRTAGSKMIFDDMFFEYQGTMDYYEEILGSSRTLQVFQYVDATAVQP